MNLHPIADKILVQVIKPWNWTDSGILLPDIALDESDHGYALAVGPRVKEIRIGDEVWYNHHAVTKLRFEGTEFVMVREPDAIAVTA
jgi:chaperonin GroES